MTMPVRIGTLIKCMLKYVRVQKTIVTQIKIVYILVL